MSFFFAGGITVGGPDCLARTLIIFLLIDGKVAYFIFLNRRGTFFLFFCARCLGLIDAAGEGGEEVLEVLPAAEEPVGAADHHGRAAHAARDRGGDQVCCGAGRRARAVCPVSLFVRSCRYVDSGVVSGGVLFWSVLSASMVYDN